jgi:nucleotide-binding universal stress UspA family protein
MAVLQSRWCPCKEKSRVRLSSIAVIHNTCSKYSSSSGRIINGQGDPDHNFLWPKSLNSTTASRYSWVTKSNLPEEVAMTVAEKVAGIQLKNIIVATDFEPSAEAATKYASALAKQFSSNLTLVNVLDLSVVTAVAAAEAGWPLEQMREESMANMDRTLNQLTSDGIYARGKRLESHAPAAAVVSLAERMHADLLVVGTTSPHGLVKLMIGSCAEGVIHHAKCPVITVGPKAGTQAKEEFKIRKVVFATDLNHHAIEKAGLALAFARESLAKVYLCYVLDSAGSVLSYSIPRQLGAEAALKKLVPRPTYEWCRPEFIVEFGDIAERIVALAKRTEADLIVLGARQSATYLTHLAKGVVEQVLAEATQPVMTLCAD